jgi:hypothetical protein
MPLHRTGDVAPSYPHILLLPSLVKNQTHTSLSRSFFSFQSPLLLRFSPVRAPGNSNPPSTHGPQGRSDGQLVPSLSPRSTSGIIGLFPQQIERRRRGVDLMVLHRAFGGWSGGGLGPVVLRLQLVGRQASQGTAEGCSLARRSPTTRMRGHSAEAMRG